MKALAVIVLYDGVIYSLTLHINQDDEDAQDFIKGAEAHFEKEALALIEHLDEQERNRIFNPDDALASGSFEYGNREIVIVWAEDVLEYGSRKIAAEAREAARELKKLISRCYEAGIASPGENLTRHVETLVNVGAGTKEEKIMEDYEDYKILWTGFGSDLSPDEISEKYQKYTESCLASNPDLRVEDFLNYSFARIHENQPGACYIRDNYRIICDSYDGPHRARVELAIFLSKIVNSTMMLEFAYDNLLDGSFGYYVRPGSVETIVYDKYPGDSIYEEAPKTNEQ